jgi:hypothetical protein
MNCQWIDSRLEALFTDNLSREELEQCQAHLASCDECRRQVESLKNVDGLVRRVFLERTVVARQAAGHNTRTRVLKMSLAAASLAAAAVVLSIGLVFFQETPAPPVAVQQPPDVPRLERNVDKKDDQTEIKLLRPGDGEPAKTAAEPHLDAATEGGPDFAITDAAGYTENLDSYRGRVFLFAVVSPDQKAAVANLQQIYDTFGPNPGIRIRGVAHRRDDKFEGVTFPVYFNQGSKLLGIGDGEFLLLDKDGNKQLDGTLDSRNLTRIRTQLGQLGIE